jgi:hypothetical protein
MNIARFFRFISGLIASGSIFALAVPAIGQTLTGTTLNVTNGPSTLTGATTLDGTLDVFNNQFSLGPSSTSFAAWLYTDNATNTLSEILNRSTASWLWATGTTAAPLSVMQLDSAHNLRLFQSDGATSGVVLSPSAYQISLGGATLTATGTALSTNGALNVTGALTGASISNTPIGTTTPSSGAFTTLSTTGNATVAGSILQSSTNAYSPQFIQTNINNTGGSAAYIIQQKARVGLSPVQAGDALGTYLIEAYADGGYQQSAWIGTMAVGAPNGPNVPTAAQWILNNGNGLVNALTVTGTGLNSTAIGATTPSTGAFTTLTTTGSVGIGMTNPATALQVGGVGSFSGIGIGTTIVGHNNASLEILNNGGNSDLQFAGPIHASSGSSIIAQTGSLAMAPIELAASTTVLGMNGNVGVGTTTPGSALTVTGQTSAIGGVLTNPQGDLSMGSFTAGPTPQ